MGERYSHMEFSIVHGHGKEESGNICHIFVDIVRGAKPMKAIK